MDPTLNLDETKTYLVVAWDDEHISRTHVTWLRFHCRCKRCMPAFTGMMALDKDVFGDDFTIKRYEIKDGCLQMDIDKEILENHTTTIPLDWLKQNCSCDKCFKKLIRRTDMKFVDPTAAPLPKVQYDDLNENEGKFQCLDKVFKHGFCIIENVPQNKLMVLKVGEMFSYIRSTHYGKHFNVISERDPINVAYTTSELPFHQDQTIYEGMPGVQLLHALEYDESIKGGESQLVDLFQAAEVLKNESPVDFHVLSEVPCTFFTIDLKREVPAWYENAMTHIQLGYCGKVVSIYWNPALEGQLKIRQEDIARYYQARARFSEIIKREDLQYTFRLKPGDLVIMNNRRMAHSRKKFENAEGNRHLQGCYINLDDMKSTYMVLAQQLGKKTNMSRCGNRSWF